jgi:predicted ArsR family transcriptional regulator
MLSKDHLRTFEAIPKEGITAKDLAAKLCISETTMRKHLRALEDKQLVAYQRVWGWYHPNPGKYYKMSEAPK